MDFAPVRDNVTSPLSNEEYIALLDSAIENNSFTSPAEDFYGSIEERVNKIFALRSTTHKHVYKTKNKNLMKFKAQTWKTLDHRIEKRTVDPSHEGNPYHYWQFKLAGPKEERFIVHFMYVKSQTSNNAYLTTNQQHESAHQPEEYNTQFSDAVTDLIEEGHYQYYEDIRQPQQETSEQNNNNTMDIEPSEDFENTNYFDTTISTAEETLSKQRWAYYSEENRTLTLHCNLNIAQNYSILNQHGADYAEWLRRNDPQEVMQPGDVIGIISSEKGITKTVSPSYVASVISTRHALCANMPASNMRHLGEPVAFKGQAPVKIIGMVNLNDVIIPSGRNDGTGIAKRLCSNSEMKNHVIGHAWEASNDPGVKLVNCMIDIMSPDYVSKDATDDKTGHSVLQQLILYNLANQEHWHTFLDLHLVDQRAILIELKDLVQRLVSDLSGLTVLIWIDQSAVPGFIKNQFLRDFGELDMLSGGVFIEEKESLILVEEWNRDVSYPDYKPIDFDQGVKRVTGVAQSLLATHKLAKLDGADNHTVVISMDMPPKIVLEARKGQNNASFINLMTKYPITRGFTSHEKVQLYQINVDSLPKVDELHFAREELWAQSAIRHKNVPNGITRGTLNIASAWNMVQFNFKKLKDHIVVEHLDCKANKLQNALLIPQETSLIIVGGSSGKAKLNEDAFKIVQDTSGRVHSFTEVKSKFIRPDAMVFKVSSNEVAVLYRDGSNLEFNTVQPEESFSLKNKGLLKIEGVPVSLILHDNAYFVATIKAEKILIYRVSIDLQTCQELTSYAAFTTARVQLVPHNTMKVQINEELYSITKACLVKHNDIKIGTIVDVSDSTILNIRLIKGKMTLMEVDLTTFNERTIGELLEVLPRTNFGCCKIRENQYALYGGIAMKSEETLSDMFTFSVQPADYIARYMNTWAAKYKIFSEKKKKRLLSYQQSAEQAYKESNFMVAEKLYEGLSKECPCFDYYYNYVESLLRARNNNEISHIRVKIEAALLLAEEYAQSLDQEEKIDLAKKTLAERTASDLSQGMKALTIDPSQKTVVNKANTNGDLKGRFEAALTKLDQLAAVACIKEGVPTDDNYKAMLSTTSHTVFIQSVTNQCCSVKNNKSCEDWAIWFVQNFTALFMKQPLIRLAIENEQRNLVSRLLQLNLTTDINDINLITREPESVAELAARKNFPEVLRFCYDNKKSEFNSMKVINAICKYANEDAFDTFMTFRINFSYSDAIQICIANISKPDVARRMKIIGKILKLVKNTGEVKADDVICWILKKCEYEWLAEITSKLRNNAILSATVISSIQPLLKFLEELADWDEDDIEPTIKLLAKKEHVQSSISQLLRAIFKSFNDCEDEVLTMKALQTLVLQQPNLDLVNHQRPNLLEFLLDEDIVDDAHCGMFFKILVAVKFNQWKMTDQKRIQLFDRFKRIANKATQEIVKQSFSNMPSSFMSVLLLDSEGEQIFTQETIKMIEACVMYGSWADLSTEERTKLLLLAQSRKISSIIDILSRK